MRKPFRLDVKNRKGEVSVFVNIEIPSKYLWRFHFPGAIQAIPWEVNVKQRKPLVVYIYRPPDQNLDHFLSFITGLLDHYLKSYKDFVIIGDFNGNESNPAMETFLIKHKCKNIINNETCYKWEEGSCIDLIITRRHSLHQFFHVFETGISDLPHLMVYTMLKSTYAKLEPKILRSLSCKDFNKESFLQDLQHGLNNVGSFAEINDEFKTILNHYAPIKQS